MDANIQDNGEKANSMALENIYYLGAKKRRVNGLKAKEFDGLKMKANNEFITHFLFSLTLIIIQI
jgi:hypothetical protein